MRLFNRHFSSYDLLLPLGDVAITMAATAGAGFLMARAYDAGAVSWSQWMTLAGVIASFVVVSFYYADLYEIDQVLSLYKMRIIPAI